MPSVVKRGVVEWWSSALIARPALLPLPLQIGRWGKLKYTKWFVITFKVSLVETMFITVKAVLIRQVPAVISEITQLLWVNTYLEHMGIA